MKAQAAKVNIQGETQTKQYGDDFALNSSCTHRDGRQATGFSLALGPCLAYR